MTHSEFRTPHSELKLVARQGFEPRQTESESVVLPLHHRAMDPVRRMKLKINQTVKPMPQEYKLLLKHADQTGYSNDLECYQLHGGYEALRQALTIEAEGKNTPQALLRKRVLDISFSTRQVMQTNLQAYLILTVSLKLKSTWKPCRCLIL